jgi:hypothetical protein
MKITFRLRGDGVVDRTFTRAWDHALEKYVRIYPVTTSYEWNLIWSTTHPGKLIGPQRRGMYQVEMEEKDYTAFLLRWS